MEKRSDNLVQDNKSSLNLENRKKLTLSGVVKVMNFDEEKIDLTTKLGNLTIKGQELKMNKLDVQNGDVIIIGNIVSMVYNGKEIKKSGESLLSKLFK